MKVIIDIPAFTPHIVGHLQGLHQAIAAATGEIHTPTDSGEYQNWEAINRGKDAAASLVEKWSVGWSDEIQNHDGESSDKQEIMSEFIGNEDLYLFLTSGEGSTKNLLEVGATPAMAANIITLGGIFGAWPTRSF